MHYQNLKDYVCIYQQVYSKKYCASVVKKLKKLNWHKHMYSQATAKGTYETVQYENELDIADDEFSETKKITEDIWHVINRYIIHDMKHAKIWFNGWSGYTPPRFNRYQVGTEMRPHCDHINTMFDGTRKGIPVLTILGSLNDKYEGGEFLMWDEPVKLGAGDIIVFPSNFLYPHAVTPVKSGTRYSFVSWVW